MTTVSEMLRRINRVNVTNEAKQSLYDTREDYVQQQREQMQHGIAGDGGLIGRYKNTKYAVSKFAQSSKAGFGNVDLRKTGKYQADLFLEVRSNDVVIGSADERSKVFRIEERYGDRIYGLFGKYRIPFIDIARETLFNRIANALHVNIKVVA